MEASLALIQICKIGMIVSIVICALSIALAVWMFFKNDIRTIHAIRSGKAERISIQQMNEDNMKTGQLRKEVDLDFASTTNTKSKKLKSKSGKLKHTNDLSGGETVPLHRETPVSGNTAVNVSEETVVDAPVRPLPIMFDIIEETVIIHTDEIV